MAEQAATGGEQALSAEMRQQRLALAALLTGAIAIAFAAIFVRLSDVGPTAVAFWRVTLAFPALFALVWLTRKPAVERAAAPLTLQTAGKEFSALAFCGLMFAGDLAVWHYSIGFTTVANATLLANLAPVFVALAAWVLFRDPPNRRLLLGMALAMAGCGILMSTSFSIDQTHLYGDLLGVITAMFYAAYQISVSRLRKRYRALTVMAWSSLTTAPVLLVLMLVLGEPVWPQSAAGWLPLLGVALFSHAGGQTLIAYGFAHLNPTFSSTSLLIQPVAAAILAWLIFGEALTVYHLAGGAVVLLGVFIAKQATRR
jgi:drug/metabolite transporter (DMT)-like permease